MDAGNLPQVPRIRAWLSCPASVCCCCRYFAGDGVGQRGSVGAVGIAVDLDRYDDKIVEPAGAGMSAGCRQVARRVVGQIRGQEVNGLAVKNAEEARGHSGVEGAYRVVLDVHVERAVTAALY